jgi:hypothetical protein
MRSPPERPPSPLIKFEDLSLAMFSQLKFIKPKSSLNLHGSDGKLSPQRQTPIMSSPTIYE